MKIIYSFTFKSFLYIFIFLLIDCVYIWSSEDTASNLDSSFEKGEYGYDLNFLRDQTEIIELVEGQSRLIVAPEYQGRVITSSSSGFKGNSYGWINYKFIADLKLDDFANPYGGEERVWLGPEGGIFSIFYKNDNLSDWKVPEEVDRESFNVVDKNLSSITLSKNIRLENRIGTKFDGTLIRTITILNRNQLFQKLGIDSGSSIKAIAYQSNNQLMNTGIEQWNKKEGTLSIWMLSMLKATPYSVAVLPIKPTEEIEVKDYLKNIPKNRIKITDKAVFFRVDGIFKSKIGIKPNQAIPYIGSYDKENKILTVIEYSIPDHVSEYVNSSFDERENPFDGDVVNIYNDGPAEGEEQIGQLFELETSSPAAFLKPGETITHMQIIYHFEGNMNDLDHLSQLLLKVSIEEIIKAF